MVCLSFFRRNTEYRVKMRDFMNHFLGRLWEILISHWISGKLQYTGTESHVTPAKDRRPAQLIADCRALSDGVSDGVLIIYYNSHNLHTINSTSYSILIQCRVPRVWHDCELYYILLELSPGVLHKSWYSVVCAKPSGKFEFPTVFTESGS